MSGSKKKGDIYIAFLLDQTGSMQPIKNDTIGGFNEFVKNQKKAPGEATLALTLFNSLNTDVRPPKSIDDVVPLSDTTYVPAGMTPLYDSFYRIIKQADKWIEENKWKGLVLVVVQTDGYENASMKHNIKELGEMIKERRANDWQFMFLGADVDAWGMAEPLNIPAGNVIMYASADQGTTYQKTADVVTSYRASGGATGDHLFDDQDDTKNS